MGCICVSRIWCSLDSSHGNYTLLNSPADPLHASRDFAFRVPLSEGHEVRRKFTRRRRSRLARAREALSGFLEIPRPRSFIHCDSNNRSIDQQELYLGSIARDRPLHRTTSITVDPATRVQAQQRRAASANSSSSTAMPFTRTYSSSWIDRRAFVSIRLTKRGLSRARQSASWQISPQYLKRRNLAGCRRFRACLARARASSLSLSLSLVISPHRSAGAFLLVEYFRAVIKRPLIPRCITRERYTPLGGPNRPRVRVVNTLNPLYKRTSR